MPATHGNSFVVNGGNFFIKNVNAERDFFWTTFFNPFQTNKKPLVFYVSKAIEVGHRPEIGKCSFVYF